jgi:hypothetical protein
MFVARKRKVKVIFYPVFHDTRESVVLFEGFKDSPACLSFRLHEYEELVE